MCAQRRLISLGIRPVRSDSSLSAWRKLGLLATHWAHNEDSDHSGQMPRLIWVFAARTCHFVGFVIRWLKSKLDRPYRRWKGTRVQIQKGRKRDKVLRTREPPNDKTNKLACASSEDSDQPGYPPSLIWIFAGRTCHFVGLSCSGSRYTDMHFDCMYLCRLMNKSCSLTV